MTSETLDNLTVKDALPQLYSQYNIQLDGGIDDPSVKVELLKGVNIYIPNLESRKKVVLKHDMHHLLTGYPLNMKGETEISSWELSTGCNHNWFAYGINTLGMITGIPFNPIGIWKAWKRGKHTRNLYNEKYQEEVLMNQKVSDLRLELGLHVSDKSKGFPFKELFSFLVFLFLGALFTITSVVLLPFIIIYTLYIIITQ